MDLKEFVLSLIITQFWFMENIVEFERLDFSEALMFLINLIKGS